MITQKTQYALRAIFELAWRYGQGPVKISDISEKQVIPIRFLEVILNQLKGGGFVESKRGFEGGYYLIRPPDQVAVMDVIRRMREPVGPVHCLSISSSRGCPLDGDCAFLPLWTEIRDTVSNAFSSTTFADLVRARRTAASKRRREIAPPAGGAGRAVHNKGGKKSGKSF
jgi:Rrf2 family protein